MFSKFTPLYLKKLELLKLSSKRAFLGQKQGGHISIKRGHGIEFSDFRQYQIGDDPRHIDWNLYARSEKMYIKRFQEEQDITLHLILDSSNSMFEPEIDKWQRVCEIALSLSYIASMNQDRIQIAIPGFLNGKKYSGKSSFYRILDDLKKVKMSPTKDYFKDVKTSIASAKFPGIAVFLSDFLFPQNDFQEIFNYLIGKNLDLTAIQVLGKIDLDLNSETEMLAVDSETGKEILLNLDSNSIKEYQEILNRHCLEINNFLLSRRIKFIKTDTNENLEDLMFKKIKNTIIN